MWGGRHTVVAPAAELIQADSQPKNRPNLKRLSVGTMPMNKVEVEVAAVDEKVVQLVQRRRERHRKITVRLAANVKDLTPALGILSAMLQDQQIADISLYLTILPS